jgi:hypothetical protein
VVDTDDVCLGQATKTRANVLYLLSIYEFVRRARVGVHSYRMFIFSILTRVIISPQFSAS